MNTVVSRLLSRRLLRAVISALLATTFTVAGSAQGTPIEALSPLQTVMIPDVVRGGLGGEISRNALGLIGLRSLAEADGIWAVLVSTTVGNSVAIGNVGGFTHAFAVEKDVRQLALDRSGHVHLLHGYATGANSARQVSVVDTEGAPIGQYTVPAAAAWPFLSGSGVVWYTGRALATSLYVAPTVQQNGVRDINETGGQRTWVGALPDGRYYTFGNASETITIHRPGGSVVASYAAPLDRAYQAIGHAVPKPPPGSDLVRVVWAATTSKGQLYICLSGLSASGPAYVAVVDVQTGALSKVIAASLPAFPELATPTEPTGTVTPGWGAAEDCMVILDQIKGVAAIYQESGGH